MEAILRFERKPIYRSGIVGVSIDRLILEHDRGIRYTGMTWPEASPAASGSLRGRYICRRTCFKRRKINVSTIFAGHLLGIQQVTNSVWLFSFMRYDLGYFDAGTVRPEPIENPFQSNVLPM